MARFDFPSNSIVNRDVDSMRQRVDSHVFYLVIENHDVASSGYDPIYGEAYDAFTTGSTLSGTDYIPFTGSILRREKDDEMFRQGFLTQEKLVIDVANVVEWSGGMLIMFEDKRYRISGVDERGLDGVNRYILYMDEVT